MAVPDLMRVLNRLLKSKPTGILSLFLNIPMSHNTQKAVLANVRVSIV